MYHLFCSFFCLFSCLCLSALMWLHARQWICLLICWSVSLLVCFHDICVCFFTCMSSYGYPLFVGAGVYTVSVSFYCTYYCLRCICCGSTHALLANLSISSSNSIVLTNRTESNFSLLESQQESQQQESQQQESQQQENQPGESQPAESEPYDSDETVDNHER